MRRYMLVGVVAICAGCSASSDGGSAPETAVNGDPVGVGGGSTSSGAATPGTGASAGSGDGGVPTGVLTAGAWDDNRNYDFFTSYLPSTTELTGVPPETTATRDAANALFAGTRPAKQRLDVAIVLDTTGSMGDEAAYLQAEFANISGAIDADFPNADTHWALVAYRDTPDTDPGDEYVVESWDFTTDVDSFQSTLGGLTAANGGDTPESPDIGLATMNTLSWRSDADVARLAFWIADAPQHDYRAAAMAQDFSDSQAKDIHLYPVSASGADDLLEVTMRTAAQLTGGRYLFLTDDSGIGDPHLVPTIPCYFVTKLAKAIVRMVDIEVSGIYEEPDATDIIRTGGNPMSGACIVDDAGMVSVF